MYRKGLFFAKIKGACPVVKSKHKKQIGIYMQAQEKEAESKKKEEASEEKKGAKETRFRVGNAKI
jgi:hypothetical protein